MLEPSQVFVPVQLSASSALVTGLQAPAPLAHERHAVVHAFWQQVPSLQKPLAHSSALLQP
jgi:RIO-like serine/threonine protein kinase